MDKLKITFFAVVILVFLIGFFGLFFMFNDNVKEDVDVQTNGLITEEKGEKTLGGITLWFLDGTVLKPVDSSWTSSITSEAAGSDKQVQYNNGGTALGGASTFVFDDTNLRVGIGTTSPYTKLGVAGEVVADSFFATTTATSTFAGAIDITETNATSTFAHGINLTTGCLAIGGTCSATHDAVTMSGTPNYITLSGQDIVRAKLDITDDTNATGGVGIDISTNDFVFDGTEIDAITWSDGANVSNIWTFDVSGTDTTATWGSALLTLSGGLTISGTLSGVSGIDSTTETTFEDAIDSLSNLTVTGTIVTGVWNGTSITNANVDDDLTISSSGSIDKGALQNSGTLSFDWVDSEIADTLTIDSSSSIDKGALANSGTLSFDWADSEVADTLTIDSGSVITAPNFAADTTATSTLINTWAENLQVGTLFETAAINATSTTVRSTFDDILVIDITATNILISGDSINDFAGTGLTVTGNALTVDASQTQITATGALDAGTITSNFGSINNGASAITTTGTGTFGDLSVTNATTTSLAISAISSAMMITDANGTIAEYTGVACTNQLIEDLSVLGAGTCSSINNDFWSGADLAVGNGGTGVSSWTQYLLLYADTTTSFSQVSIGTSGQVLTSNGAGSVASFQTLSIAAGEYAAASIDGDDVNSNIAGAHLTLTSASPDTLDLDSNIAVVQVGADMFATTTANGIATTSAFFIERFTSYATTITAFRCHTHGTAGTSTVQVTHSTDPFTAGTDILYSTGFECGSDLSVATTTFSDTTVPADSFWHFSIDDAEPTGARPTIVHAVFTADKDD